MSIGSSPVTNWAFDMAPSAVMFGQDCFVQSERVRGPKPFKPIIQSTTHCGALEKIISAENLFRIKETRTTAPSQNGSKYQTKLFWGEPTGFIQNLLRAAFVLAFTGELAMPVWQTYRRTARYRR